MTDLHRGPQTDGPTLRSAFGTFATGVTVVTTRQADGTPRGFTANSFTSVSLDPPLLLVCISKSAHSCTVFAEAPTFAVNVLSEEQKGVSGLFASREVNKFDQCAWRAGAEDAPLITGALSHFTCRREQLVDAGDHVILIGRVIDVSFRDGNPLGFFRGRYFQIGLENTLVHAAADRQGTRVGVILARDGAVLMQVQSDHRLALPLSPGPVPSIEALERQLNARGLTPVTEFLYAVFDDRKLGGHAIYYHGRLEGGTVLPPDFRLVALSDLPTASMMNEAEAQMLARYAEELRHGTFGIYQGNETTGTVRRVGDI